MILIRESALTIAPKINDLESDVKGYPTNLELEKVHTIGSWAEANYGLTVGAG